MRALTRLKSAAAAAALAVVAGTLALSAGPGSPAQAAPGDPRLVDVEIVKTSGRTGDLQHQQVSCPGGKVAVGGGADVTIGSTPFSQDLSLVGSFPTMSEDGTAATGWESVARFAWADQTTMTLTTYAICAWAPPGYEAVSSGPAEIPSGQTAEVTCPAGKAVLGGGGEVQDSGTMASARPTRATPPDPPPRTSGPSAATAPGAARASGPTPCARSRCRTSRSAATPVRASPRSAAS